MSGVIAKAIAPTLRKLKKYIADLPMLRNEEGKSMVKNDFPRYVRHVKDILNLMKGAVLCLKEQNELWIKLIYALQGEDRSKEEKMYDEMTKDPEGMIQVMDDAREIIIKLQSEIDEAENSMRNNSRPKPQSSAIPQVISANSNEELQSTSPDAVLNSVVPKFDGNIVEWPAFWSRYKEAVHNSKVSDSWKLIYLKSFLTGSAYDLVESYAATSENYPIVLNILEEKYGKDELIQSTLRKQLRQLPEVREGSSLISALSFIEDILKKYETTKGYVDVNYLQDVIEEKLPDEIVKNMCKKKMKSCEAWNVSALRRLLHEELVLLERIEFRRKNSERNSVEKAKVSNDKSRPEVEKEDSSGRTKGRPSAVSENSSSRRQPVETVQSDDMLAGPCIFCRGDHFNENCTVYASITARKRRIKELHIYERCFKKRCSAERCNTMMRSCFYCKSCDHKSGTCPARCNQEKTKQLAETGPEKGKGKVSAAAHPANKAKLNSKNDESTCPSKSRIVISPSQSPYKAAC